MQYGYTNLATDWNEKEMKHWSIRLIKALLFFIPRANPDHENLYPKVNKWLLEIDEKGIPEREIALDKNDNPLFKSPNERNTGLWTDSPDVFKKEDLQEIEKEQFEALWAELK